MHALIIRAVHTAPDIFCILGSVPTSHSQLRFDSELITGRLLPRELNHISLALSGL